MVPETPRPSLPRVARPKAGPALAERRFLAHQLAKFRSSGAETAVYGAPGWTAPVAHYVAPQGFGEALWVDRQDETIIAWARSGERPVISECPTTRGRMGRPGAPEFTLQPVGGPNHFRSDGPVEFAQFYLPTSLIEHVAGALEFGRPAAALLRDDLAFVTDAVLVASLDDYLARAADAADPPSALEAETRAVLVAERLISRHLLGVRSGPAPRVGDWRVRKAMEMMDGDLGARLSLAALAAEVDLSASQLIKLFRAATGSPPHQWLTRRRIARAREMLAGEGRSVTDTALSLGFSSSQHLATAFRREVGTTPSAWRAAAGGRPGPAG